MHALLGENGAGKSTLINILSGVITDYDGEVAVDGTPVQFTGPAAAQAAGIATIHQELDLVPALSVADNLVLGREPRTRLRTVDRRPRAAPRASTWTGSAQTSTRAARWARCASASSNSSRSPRRSPWTPAYSSWTSRRPRSPTRMYGGCSPQSAACAAGGVGVVYISHRMEEIEVVADRATVLRNGSVAGVVPAGRMDRRRIVAMMVGGRAASLFEPAPAETAGAPGRRPDPPAAARCCVSPTRRAAPDAPARPLRAGRRQPDRAGRRDRRPGRADGRGTYRTAGDPVRRRVRGRRTGAVLLAGRPYAPRRPARHCGPASASSRRTGAAPRSSWTTRSAGASCWPPCPG
ncbi:ATP-binding cassette domain-containing protein [Micromonospora sp. BRA006-A]|nr:ATP-binding cassette domain-containing protein [Micromonospora sp. BRA006-A]